MSHEFNFSKFGRQTHERESSSIDEIIALASSHEFNFSKFGRQPHEKESSGRDEIIALASIVVPPTDPLEQYLLEHQNDMHMEERDEDNPMKKSRLVGMKSLLLPLLSYLLRIL